MTHHRLSCHRLACSIPTTACQHQSFLIVFKCCTSSCLAVLLPERGFLSICFCSCCSCCCRTRVTCAEEIGYLVDKDGPRVYSGGHQQEVTAVLLSAALLGSCCTLTGCRMPICTPALSVFCSIGSSVRCKRHRQGMLAGQLQQLLTMKGNQQSTPTWLAWFCCSYGFCC